MANGITLFFLAFALFSFLSMGMSQLETGVGLPDLDAEDDTILADKRSNGGSNKMTLREYMSTWEQGDYDGPAYWCDWSHTMVSANLIASKSF